MQPKSSAHGYFPATEGNSEKAQLLVLRELIPRRAMDVTIVHQI